MAKEPFGIICSPWHLRTDALGLEMAKGRCSVCEAEVAYDVDSHERVRELAAREGTTCDLICESCAAGQMSAASDEELEGVRKRFRDMGNPGLAVLLDLFTNDELRAFFAKLRRPVQ